PDEQRDFAARRGDRRGGFENGDIPGPLGIARRRHLATWPARDGQNEAEQQQADPGIQDVRPERLGQRQAEEAEANENETDREARERDRGAQRQWMMRLARENARSSDRGDGSLGRA